MAKNFDFCGVLEEYTTARPAAAQQNYIEQYEDLPFVAKTLYEKPGWLTEFSVTVYNPPIDGLIFEIQDRNGAQRSSADAQQFSNIMISPLLIPSLNEAGDAAIDGILFQETFPPRQYAKVGGMYVPLCREFRNGLSLRVTGFGGIDPGEGIKCFITARFVDHALMMRQMKQTT